MIHSLASTLQRSRLADPLTMGEVSEIRRGDVWMVVSVSSAYSRGGFHLDRQVHRETQGRGGGCVSVPSPVAEEAVGRRAETRGRGFVR